MSMQGEYFDRFDSVCIKIMFLSVTILLKPGFSSMDCSVLLPGYYVFNDTAYSCNCSNKTDDCNQDPNVSDMPSELCECPEGYDGNSCEVSIQHNVL